jgi:LuxR family maltose regulon positive regulatory protein
LTLVSAPAGFGKTTTVSEWLATYDGPVAWLSLDEADRDPNRFVAYLVAALQTVAADIGHGLPAALQSAQPPLLATVLADLVNEIASIAKNAILVLDDYHAADARPIDDIVAMLLGHLPPQLHLVIITRQDPRLPLARLRARGQLTELRAADLRFSPAEAALFLNHSMGLQLAERDIDALEARTEGWIVGLQLAAISMRGIDDPAGFIAAFTGSHRFVLDYLVEEVLQQQPDHIQTFLLRTSLLERLSGPLCDAVLLDVAASGSATLEYLDRANLFVVALDNERQWYRYHHLFAELLRQRLSLRTLTSPDDVEMSPTAIHGRASAWFEEHGLELEAFRHATAANDVARAEHLIDGNGMPLVFRGGVVPVLSWLASLPTTLLQSSPSLWTTYASVLLVTGTTQGVEQMLEQADTALRRREPDATTRDLIGRNAATWATLACKHKQPPAILAHSRRALEYLHPNNHAFRTATAWKLGYAAYLQGDRDAARRAFTEARSASMTSGNSYVTILATIALGRLQEQCNDLCAAAETFRHALQLLADQPLPVACDAHLGLARISYAWNDLAGASAQVDLATNFARQRDNNDRLVACQLLLASVKRAQGDAINAAALVAAADRAAREHGVMARMPEVASAQVRTLLDQGELAAAAQLAAAHDLPLSQARVQLALGKPGAALDVLEPLWQRLDGKGWEDERLRLMVLLAIAHDAHGDADTARRLVGEATALAAPSGCIRLFLDEGLPMRRILSTSRAGGAKTAHLDTLLAAFAVTSATPFGVAAPASLASTSSMIEPLSQRELEVLGLVAQGLSNREISERLFLALDTVKGHNRVIFSKLQVQRRTEAVARARELALL